MKERFYDRLNGALDRKGFGERRDSDSFTSTRWAGR